MKQYLGLQEVAQLLNMSKQNVQMHMKSQTFPNPIVYVGTRSGWALEQIVDYAKKKGIQLNNEEVKKYETSQSKSLAPEYYLGVTDVANLLGWQPAKVKTYQSRKESNPSLDVMPLPVVSIGNRRAWTFEQLQKFATEKGIVMQEVANENLAKKVLETTEQEWLLVPSYSGKWITQKETIESKDEPRTIAGKKVVAQRTVRNLYDAKVFDNKKEAIDYLLHSMIESNLVYGVTTDFEKDLIRLGGLVEVGYRYEGYRVLPKEKVLDLLHQELKGQDLSKLALQEMIMGSKHGVVAFDLRKGKIVHYGVEYDAYPPLNAVAILYWVDKDTRKHHDLTDKIEEQLKEFYK